MDTKLNYYVGGAFLETNRLISYNVLKKDIIENGFCTACGACEAVCPVTALQIENEQVKRLYDCSKSLDLCPICYEICPHSEAFLLRSLEAVSDAPAKNLAFGYYRKILLAQSNDPKVREKSHDGAVVTKLLAYGLNNRIFDSAIVTQTEKKSAVKPNPSVALVTDDILSSIGSKFFPSAVLKTYGDAVSNHGKKAIAVVGVPCHVLALRKIDSSKHKISGKSKVLIGLFCFGMLSFRQFLASVEKKYNVSSSEIKKMHLSKDLMLETKRGVIVVPLSEVKEYILPSCRTCIDFTSELADISVGSAYPLKDWSTVVIRTKIGEEFFNDAVLNGIINTRPMEQEPEVLEQTIVTALRKRTAGFVEASKVEKALGFVPVRLLRETDSLATVKVEEIMTKDVTTVPSGMTVSELLGMIATKPYIGYPVIDEKGELSGVVTIEEASMVDKASRWKTLVGSIARQNVDVCYPGETALDAFRKMSNQETGRIIILDPENPDNIIGILTKRDLMHFLVRQASDSDLSALNIKSSQEVGCS